MDPSGDGEVVERGDRVCREAHMVIRSVEIHGIAALAGDSRGFIFQGCVPTLAAAIRGGGSRDFVEHEQGTKRGVAIGRRDFTGNITFARGVDGRHHIVVGVSGFHLGIHIAGSQHRIRDSDVWAAALKRALHMMDRAFGRASP